MGAAGTRGSLGGEGGGGEIHGPEHQAGGGEVDTAGVHDAEDFGTVQVEVAASVMGTRSRGMQARRRARAMLWRRVRASR